jgi:hypothetical protein
MKIRIRKRIKSRMHAGVDLLFSPPPGGPNIVTSLFDGRF